MLKAPDLILGLSSNGYVSRIGANSYAASATIPTSDISIPYIGASPYTTLNKYLDVTQSPGIISGGDMTDGGGGNINVAAGVVLFRVADDDVSQLVMSPFGPQVVAIAADNVVHYLAVDYNGGTPTVIQSTAELSFDKDTQIPIGSAVRLGATTLIFDNQFKVGDALTNVIQRFDSLASVNRDNSVGGLILGETGTRNITISAGQIWARLNNTPVAAKNTSTGDTLVSVYYNGASWVFTPALTQWPNAQYNDVASGLVAMGANRYSNLWFYLTVDTATIFMQYGQAEYNNYAQALAEMRPTFTPPNAPYVALLIGRLIFQNGDATAQLIQSAFSSDFAGTVVTDHNDLANIQGGTTGEYFHLTSAQHTPLVQIGNLADPNADRIVFWDDSAGSYAFLAPGNSVAITGTTLDTIQDIRTTATPQFLQLGVGIPAQTGIAIAAEITADDALGLTIVNDTATQSANILARRKRATGSGEVQSGDRIGQLIFRGYNATSAAYNNMAFLRCEADGAPSGAITPGRLLGMVTRASDGAQLEVWRADSAGLFTLSGSVQTAAPSGGTAQPWKLGNYTAGAAAQVGKVRVEINGTPYDLLTA